MLEIKFYELLELIKDVDQLIYEDTETYEKIAKYPALRLLIREITEARNDLAKELFPNKDKDYAQAIRDLHDHLVSKR